MSAQHTPGPWRHRPVYRGSEVIRDEILSAAGVIADDIREAADARLIAAAPEMLDVLRVVEWGAEVDMETGGNEPGCPSCGGAESVGHNAECRIAAAIAKATGAA